MAKRNQSLAEKKRTGRITCRSAGRVHRSSRKQFLLQFASLAAASAAGPVSDAGANRRPKVLIVVAHPDDEYTFAATVYRITKELGGVADQVVITNGEAGFRYSGLAATYYGLALLREDVARTHLPEIRREETLRAGRILGIRKHDFLGQKDARFTLDAAEAFSGIWDVVLVRRKLVDLIRTEHYDFILGLLPTEFTHGHHQAAMLLTIQAVRELPPEARPVVLGSEPTADGGKLTFHPQRHFPLLRVFEDAPVYSTNRLESFGPNGTLNYNIVVNWVIAEHKSQGLFQTECGKHTRENFLVFDTGTPGAVAKADALFEQIRRRILISTR